LGQVEGERFPGKEDRPKRGEYEPEVSMVMPGLKQAETLKRFIPRVGESVRRHNLKAKTIIADKRSMRR
jgi:hypothetical protein